MRHTLAPLAMAALIGASTAPATAASFSTLLDDVLIIRSGATYFRDTFGDGIAPPSAEAFTGVCGASAPNCWNVFGSFPAGAESGGKLRLDSANGLPSANASGTDVITQRIRLVTNRSDAPEDALAGLKIGRSFSASAVFGLAVPGPGDTFILRLTDAHADVTAPGHQNDYLQLQVRRSTVVGAVPEISLRKQDFQAGTITLLGSTPLDLGLGADQIRLTLDHPTPDSNDVFGSWQYLAAGAVVGSGSFATPGTVFTGETWTRVDVAISAVPEPTSWATMLVGAGLVGWRLRRRGTRGQACRIA